MAFIGLLLNGLVVGLFVMALMLFFIPIPKIKEISNYAVSLKFLSFTYVYLGVYLMFKSNEYPTDIFCLPFILTCSLQMQLLGLSHVNMLNTKYVSAKYIVKMLMPTILFVVAVSISIYLKGYHRIDSYDYLFSNILTLQAPDVTVRSLWFLYYLVCSIYYVYLFILEEIKMKEKVENFSSEFNVDAFRFIHYSFVVCMVILAATFVVALSPNQKVCGIANLIILFLYFIVGFLYIQYPKAFLVINDMEKEISEDSHVSDSSSANTSENVIWQAWKNRVVSNKYYLRQGLTIVQLAQLLGTNRNTLSATINQNEKKNFNSFINELRIGEAKEIMRENPTLTLADICTRVGYTDQANFSRHFKEVVGMSPVAWKNSQQL